MSILDRLPRRPSCTAHLDADHAHLLLDALALAERMIEGHRPWTDYDNPNPADPKTTEAGGRSPRVLADLLGITVEVRRRADHTTVHLDITGLPPDAGPVRVSARTTDTGPVARPRVTILELLEAGR